MDNEEKWVWDPTRNEQKSVVRIDIDGVDWLMEWSEYQKAKEEMRTEAIIYDDKLIFVDKETAEELKKLEEWLKIKKEI